MPLDIKSAIIIQVARKGSTAVKTPGGTEKIAHDFRASLNIIIGFAELMLDEAPGKINAAQRQALTDILNNGRRLQSLSEEVIKELENRK